jgi:PIN domain nuclease of toxin-antitoxin system
MKFILDTHTWLWWVLEPELLNPKAIEIIASKDKVYLSAVSTWEVSVKSSIGKLTLPGGHERFIADAYRLDGFLALAITPEHTLPVGTLPFFHKDPFDRLLVAQALCEGATIISSDPLIKQYSVSVLDPAASFK